MNETRPNRIGVVHLSRQDKPFLPRADCGSVYRERAGERWYVVHTQSHLEDSAVVNLERQAFTTFCPRAHKTVRHARKTTQVLAPLFPGYLFVCLDPDRDRWRSINGTRGVIRILSHGDKPLAVPQGVVEALMARTSSHGAIDWLNTLKSGDAVRLSDGPFAEFVGQIEHLDGAGRVRVLLDLMGRAVSVVVRADMVAPVA